MPVDTAREAISEAVTRLVADLEVKREDSARLDDYEAMCRGPFQPGIVSNSITGFAGWNWQGVIYGTLRAALDAARKG